MDRPFILTVANRKGGVGKSTTVVNLAVAWSQMGRRILVVDLDTQGHASLGLGQKAVPKKELSIHRIFRGESCSGSDMIRVARLENIHVVPPERSYEEGGSAVKRDLLTRWLREIATKEQWDLVLIDTPPSLGALLINALNAADGVLVPFSPHFLGMDGVRQLLRLVLYLGTGGEEQGEKTRKMALLPVMVDLRMNQHRQVLEELMEQFGKDHLLQPGIRSNIRVAEAFGAFQSVLEYAPQSAGAQDYLALADQLSQQWQLYQSCVSS